MKKLLPALSLILFLSFVTSGLYIFGLPPFQSGGPFFPAAPQNPQTEQGTQKVERNKTYTEHISRGALLEQNGYYSLAIAEYEAASKLDLTNPEPFVKIGRIHLLNHEYDAAVANFQQANKLAPNNTDTLVYLGRSYLGNRQIDEAKNLFANLNADSQTAKYYQGIIAAFSGEYDKSKDLLKKAVEMGGSDDITKKAQNYLNAFNEFNFNQGGEPIHLKALLARSFNQTGEYQLAIPLLFDVIKAQKDYRDAWVLLGYAYLSIDKYQDALESLNQAKNLDPQKPETYYFLGLTYYDLNNLPLAAANLELAKKNGFQPVIQINQKLAEIYLQLKDYNKSAQNYENVLAINDQDINYYIRPIWLYTEKTNQPDKALSLAEKAYLKHPNEAMSYNLLAWAQISAGQLDQAEKNLQTGINIDPQLEAIYLNFGLLNEKKGNTSQALTYYQKAHDMGKGNSISASATERYTNLVAKVKGVDPNTLKANVLNAQ
ncbi:MAG: tetratricopeptide repeat protein [Candidatus Gracilibacteria bacterium]|jgi:tetratricopeptide (TPR) repeat protein